MKKQIIILIAILMACRSTAWSNPGSVGDAASRGETVALSPSESVTQPHSEDFAVAQGELITFPCIEVTVHQAFLDAQGEAKLTEMEQVCRKLDSDADLTPADFGVLLGDEDLSPSLEDIQVLLMLAVTSIAFDTVCFVVGNESFLNEEVE